MDFLVLSPPVVTSAEPPSGAFMLAAGLKGRGMDVGLLDLSLAFFYRLFDELTESERKAIRYLLGAASGYSPMKHRSETGHLHGRVSRFNADYPGWKLTLMDIAPPALAHDPSRIAAALVDGPNPFRQLYDEVLTPALTQLRPTCVLVSVAYLSQLAGAIELVSYLQKFRIPFHVGGSLVNSLATTGHGYESVQQVLGPLTVGDGRSLLQDDKPLLSQLAWPDMVYDGPYMSSHPVVPLALSTGCFWNQCLFCPDREMPYYSVPMTALEQFIESIPSSVMVQKPVLHLIDSAIPPGRLRRFLPLIAQKPIGFFGFARPTRQLCKDNLIEQAADAGCLMLQLGVEGGSGVLLDRFQKGIDPTEAETVVQTASNFGIRTYLYMLSGLPTETASDLAMTVDFLKRNAAHIDFLNLSLFNLPRYCELLNRLEEFNIDVLDFPGDDNGIRLYRPFLSDGEDKRQRARAHLKQLRGIAEIKEAILRTPRWFRAAHLALMNIPGRHRITLE